ncbi:ScbR family autoregulator-binding transcription factor [Streptomyces sp. NPDC048484]|uniref:ScbR family autoregulator-binding transcription factor n=1 Tax=Streptomyces sp. NPDC048484 TaxID=3155146 RepID=UPI00342506AD
MAQQERALRTRGALIESAAEMFDQHGFTLSSLSAISSRAEVSNGTLHFHFASKAALAEAVGAAAAQRLDRITGKSAGHTRGGALQLLIDATHTLVRELGHDAVLRAGFDPRRSLRLSGASADPRRMWKAWVRGSLVRAGREGAMARGVPADTVAATVVAATLGFGLLHGRKTPHADPLATVTQFWVLLLPRLAVDTVLDDLVASGTRAEVHGPSAPGRGGSE